MKKNKTRTFTLVSKDAERYGEREALFLQYLVFWIQKNEKKKVGLHEERYWTYFTCERLRAKTFTWWPNRHAVQKVIKNLEEKGAILVRRITHHENGNRIFGGKAFSVTLTDSYLERRGYSR